MTTAKELEAQQKAAYARHSATDNDWRADFRACVAAERISGTPTIEEAIDRAEKMADLMAAVRKRRLEPPPT